MLECIYCMLHVLSASPLAALAKSCGTTNTMRVECVIHVSLRMYILVMSISISFYLSCYLPLFECCMLECMYCMLHVLSASPLAALAKSCGTTNTMRVECVIHVSLRMYILVMSISISFYLILSICCDEKCSSIV